MSWLRVAISLGEFALAMTLVVLALYASLRIYNKLTGDQIDLIQQIRDGNVAVGIFVTALVVTPAWIILGAIGPTTYLLRIALLTDAGAMSAITIVLTAVVHVAFGFVMALLSIWFAVWLFDKLTGVTGQWEALKQGNVAVALVLAGVIFLVAMFMQQSLENLSSSLLPDLPIGQVRGLD